MKEKRIRRAEIVIIFAVLAAMILPGLFGGGAAKPKGTAKYSVPADMNGHRIAAMTGSEYAELAGRIYPDSEVSLVVNWADTAMLVSQGKAEGFMVERMDAQRILKEYPDLAMLDQPIKDMEYSFLTQHNDAGVALADEFDAFLSDLRASGEYTTLRSKWIDQGENDAVLEPCNSDGTRGVLHIATCNDWVPYCYVVEGETVGFFIELIYRFCERAHYALDMSVVAFDAGFMGVGAGKYDMLAYGYIYSEERSTGYTFTDPIDGDELMMLVRRDCVAGAQETAADAAPEKGFFERIAESFEKNFLREKRYKMMLSGLGVTLALSLCAGVTGTLLGALICGMQRSANPYALGFARLYVKTFQGMPIVVLLLLLYYVVFGKSSADAFIVCTLGFSLDFSAYAAEIFSSGIEAVPRGQFRAALALGYGRAGAFKDVVLPEAMQHILPVYRGQFITMVKTTAVAGYISVQDLTKVSDIIRSRTYEALFPLVVTAAIYFLLAGLLVSLLKFIEVRTDPKKRSRAPKGVTLC